MSSIAKGASRLGIFYKRSPFGMMCYLAATLAVFSALSHAFDNGRVRRGWLGMRVADNSPQIQQALDLETSTGVVVMEITKGSPAEMAGFQKGDVITQVASVAVSDPFQFSREISVVPPGDTILIKFNRGSEVYESKVTIGEAPSDITSPPGTEQAAVADGNQTNTGAQGKFHEKDSGAIDLLDQKAQGPVRNTYEESDGRNDGAPSAPAPQTVVPLDLREQDVLGRWFKEDSGLLLEISRGRDGYQGRFPNAPYEDFGSGYEHMTMRWQLKDVVMAMTEVSKTDWGFRFTGRIHGTGGFSENLKLDIARDRDNRLTLGFDGYKYKMNRFYKR